MKIVTLTLAEAVSRLHLAGLKISKETQGEGLKSGVYSFGVGFTGQRGGTVYQIFSRQLDEWIAERSEEEG
jgi:hypothetical protein